MVLDWKTSPAKAYGALAKDVIALQGYKPGMVPIITRQDHPQQWRDWYAYYGFRGLKFSQEIMREKSEKTVPTLSPFDFDAEFNLSRPAPEVPRDGVFHHVPMTQEQAIRHARLIASFHGRQIETAAPDRYKKSA